MPRLKPPSASADDRNKDVTPPSSPAATTSESILSILAPVYVGYRMWLANRMPIMDCDEVYNYWEPLHYLLFGLGLQTWEYANEYALRTYAYLTPLVGLSQAIIPYIQHIPPSFWTFLGQSFPYGEPFAPKVALFWMLRALLAGGMGLAELCFCHALVPTASPTVSVTTAFLLITSTGMSHASGALLPSSTLMLLWMLGAAAYLSQRHVMFSVAAILATLATGWPFGCLMFVPLGVDILIKEYRSSRLVLFLLKLVLITGTIQGAVLAIDYQLYGKVVSPTWNILQYNASAGGDELYGIEPISYYIKNVLLNFNYVAVVGLLGLPMALLGTANERSREVIVLLLPMYLWLAVVVPRSHKEERFLFSIYPLLCLGAALVADRLARGIISISSKKASPSSSKLAVLNIMLFAPAGLLGISRTAALSKYYSAPLQVYTHLAQLTQEGTTVCTCGEWYRFPSSFYLHDNLLFVPSSFQGQLPAPFSEHGSRPGTSFHFNDQNREEMDRYIDLEDCDYLVDLMTSTECREGGGSWDVLAHLPFLEVERTDTLHRTLYIPYWHEDKEQQGGVEYVDYVLYRKAKQEVQPVEEAEEQASGQQERANPPESHTS